MLINCSSTHCMCAAVCLCFKRHAAVLWIHAAERTDQLMGNSDGASWGHLRPAAESPVLPSPHIKQRQTSTLSELLCCLTLPCSRSYNMLQSCQLRAPCSQQHTCVARRPSRFPSQHQQRRPVLVSAAQPNRDFGVNPLRRNDADIQANPLYNPKPGEAPAAGTTGYSPPPDMYPGHGVVPNVPPGVPYTVDAQGNQVPNFEGAAIGAVAAALSSMDGSSNPGPGVSVEWTQWMPPSPTGSMDGGQPPNPNPLSSMDGSNQPNPNPMSSIDDGKPPVPVPNPMYSMDGGQPASAKQPSAVKATPREMPYVPSGAPETTVSKCLTLLALSLLPFAVQHSSQRRKQTQAGCAAVDNGTLQLRHLSQVRQWVWQHRSSCSCIHTPNPDHTGTLLCFRASL
jgi:hypothetical protein